MTRRLLLAALVVALAALTAGAQASAGHRARHARACSHPQRARCTRSGSGRARHGRSPRPASRRATVSARAGATTDAGGANTGTDASAADPGAGVADGPALGPAPGSGSPSDPGPPTPTPPPARLQISAREFTISLSHPEIVAGPAVLEFLNGGQDPHDLHLRPSAGGAEAGSFAVAAPGSRSDQRFTIAAGSYVLYCSLPGHEALGMHATLIVN